MGFLKNLKNLFFSPVTSGQSNFINFKIKCSRCNEEILVNLRKSSDISRIYEDEGGPSGASFFVRKEILGSKCNNLIYLTAYFDESFNLISSDVSGGKLIE